MNSKREFRQSVKIYKANVVPRSLDRTVLVDIVKMQLKPIATVIIMIREKRMFVYVRGETNGKEAKLIHNFKLTQIEFVVAQ